MIAILITLGIIASIFIVDLFLYCIVVWIFLKYGTPEDIEELNANEEYLWPPIGGYYLLCKYWNYPIKFP